MGEFVVLYGIVGIIRMGWLSWPRMEETNDVSNNADGERRGCVVMSYIRMDGLKGNERG